MLFNSLSFLIFLPTVLFLYRLLAKKYRWAMLLVASYYFYMSWNVKYALLIAFSTIVTYQSGILIEKVKTKKAKQIVVAVSFITNLAILVFYKYFNFFSESISEVFHLFLIDINLPILDLLLPVGISFYTFQALSYTMDVYRNEIKAERHLGIYALFVSYFPQLVAGPIERSKNLLPQLRNLEGLCYANLRSGGLLVLWGFFKKLVIADKISILIGTVYENPAQYFGIEIFAAVILFSVQIYCDFSGYTDIARGVARLMGVDLMKNFDSPYFSKSITEFWRRWHISLSTWFRDYLYIPLGGNRKGINRTYLNLLIVFVVSGLWHGASINFVIWGFLHGVLIVLEKIFPTKNDKLGAQDRLSYNTLKILLLNTFVIFLWIFFRADTFSDSIVIINNLFNWNAEDVFNGNLYNLGLSKGELWLSVFFIAVMLIVEYYNSFIMGVREMFLKQHYLFRLTFYVVIILTILIFGTYGEEQKEFIYFQF
ncbi:MAG: MBOAT family O-acyltransferase [Allomuricauda sp.]